MLHFNCVARSLIFARALTIACALASCLWTLEPAQCQQPVEEAIEQLIAQLHHPRASGRAAAATRLARYGRRGASATERLIECLSDTESDVRLAAAYALGCVQQDSVRVLSALVPLLADDDEHVRYSAEWSIARIAKQLEDEPNASRRRGLISAFETAMDHLRSHEHQVRHRVAIELALARLRHAALEERPSDPPSVPPSLLPQVGDAPPDADAPLPPIVAEPVPDARPPADEPPPFEDLPPFDLPLQPAPPLPDRTMEPASPPRPAPPPLRAGAPPAGGAARPSDDLPSTESASLPRESALPSESAPGDAPLPGDASSPREAASPLETPSAWEPAVGGRSGGAGNPSAQPVRPRAPVKATAAESREVASAELPQLVEVFYGTNRSRIASDAPPQELAMGLLATAGGGLLAMLLCLIGFLRSGHRPFAIVALIAIGAVAPFGFRAAQSYSRSTLRPAIAYGCDYRADIELGVCEVSIPPGHEPGMLESPNLLKLEVQQDVAKHIVLTSIEQLSQERFFDQLHSRMAADGKNILVFIHGYNVSFEDAARRTAQMAADLKFPGAPVFYSWPSQANWYGYQTDKENIELSVTQIKSFLLELAAKSGATTINLVAHSMGNVGLTEALKEMDGISPQPLFNQVVLAAPDIDADVFKNRVAPYIVTKAHHVTLYTSQTDLALIASRYFNSGPRVGDSGSGVLLFPGIDTIDATAVDSSLLGHSYYGSNVSVLTDLGRVLENQPIANRQYLRTVINAAQPYWAFDPLRLSQQPAAGTPR